MFITLGVIGGTLEASGTLPGLIEEGGECVLTVTRGDEAQSVNGSTAVGPESTFCALLTIPIRQLETGEWAATLSYRSDSHHGLSDVEMVTIP